MYIVHLSNWIIHICIANYICILRKVGIWISNSRSNNTCSKVKIWHKMDGAFSSLFFFYIRFSQLLWLLDCPIYVWSFWKYDYYVPEAAVWANHSLLLIGPKKLKNNPLFFIADWSLTITCESKFVKTRTKEVLSLRAVNTNFSLNAK